MSEACAVVAEGIAETRQIFLLTLDGCFVDVVTQGRDVALQGGFTFGRDNE